MEVIKVFFMAGTIGSLQRTGNLKQRKPEQNKIERWKSIVNVEEKENE